MTPPMCRSPLTLSDRSTCRSVTKMDSVQEPSTMFVILAESQVSGLLVIFFLFCFNLFFHLFFFFSFFDNSHHHYYGALELLTPRVRESEKHALSPFSLLSPKRSCSSHRGLESKFRASCDLWVEICQKEKKKLLPASAPQPTAMGVRMKLLLSLMHNCGVNT